MARNNFQYEKRQRELDKKRKADDKAKRKLETKDEPNADGTVAAQDGDGDGEGAPEVVTDDASDATSAPAALPSSPA
jgi:hypothetical protein